MGILEDIESIWIEAGRPGAAKLRDAAKRKGVKVTAKDAQQFVNAQAEAQVFRAAPRSKGKVTSTELNDTWQADLVDYTAKDPSSNDGYRFALVVTDVFSRKSYTEPLKTKKSGRGGEGMQDHHRESRG